MVWQARSGATLFGLAGIGQDGVAAQAWNGATRPSDAGCGDAGKELPGMAESGVARLSRHGVVRRDGVRRGRVRLGRHGAARTVKLGFGKARISRAGIARSGPDRTVAAWSGQAWQVWRENNYGLKTNSTGDQNFRRQLRPDSKRVWNVRHVHHGLPGSFAGGVAGNRLGWQSKSHDPGRNMEEERR